MAEQKFEDALRELETIVDNLENGDLNLDEAIKKYEEGMKLSGSCYKKLQEIQKKVEVLVKDSSGKLLTKNFSSSDNEEKDEQKKQKRASKSKRPRGEGLLF
ncbi:exodeoxyribonuclease VII small subunit [Candidatus Omnitrophota bacterium]